MSTAALIMMISWQGVITLVAGYFFYRVLTSGKKNNSAEQDPSTDFQETGHSEGNR